MSSLDDAKKASGDVSNQLDEGFTAFTRVISRTAATTQVLLQDGYKSVLQVLDDAQGYVDAGAATATAVQDAAISGVKSVIAYTAANPYTAYAGGSAAVLLALPATRRLLWRYTLGSFSSPESVIKRNESKVESIKAKLTDYTAQVQKLEERLLLGEDELKRGYAKLKATRLELQRLGSQVASSQATAQGVVRELRVLKQVDASLALRGEAASQAAALKAHLARINKGVHRIASKDI